MAATPPAANVSPFHSPMIDVEEATSLFGISVTCPTAPPAALTPSATPSMILELCPLPTRQPPASESAGQVLLYRRTSFVCGLRCRKHEIEYLLLEVGTGLPVSQ